MNTARSLSLTKSNGQSILDIRSQIELEPDEDVPPGCRIAIFRDKTAQVREVLRREGIDPDSGNLVGTASDGVYVYFNSWGIIDGWGESLPPPIPADNYDM